MEVSKKFNFGNLKSKISMVYKSNKLITFCKYYLFQTKRLDIYIVG